jgi:hypothetical protein
MIKSGDMVAVQKMIATLGADIKKIIKSALEISYFSRGGWDYAAVLAMSQSEREMAVDFINERLKIASKSQHPIY